MLGVKWYFRYFYFRFSVLFFLFKESYLVSLLLNYLVNWWCYFSVFLYEDMILIVWMMRKIILVLKIFYFFKLIGNWVLWIMCRVWISYNKYMFCYLFIIYWFILYFFVELFNLLIGMFSIIVSFLFLINCIMNILDL